MNDAGAQHIVEWYDICEANLRKWWDLDQSLAIHAGFWDESTKTLREALQRENEILAAIAGVQPSDHVLDAGCGVGGSAIFLCERIGCRVTGITLSEKQVATATRKASERQLKQPPVFVRRDFHDTGLPGATFDVVWAIESVCHAHDKSRFVREAYRLLKPGGRLIVADGFQVHDTYPPSAQRLLDKAMHNWAVDALESIANFESHLERAGFKEIRKEDATHYVRPSSRRLFFYSFPAIPLSKLGEWFGWSSKLQTGDFVGYHYQYRALRKQLCRYLIFRAEK